jgi:hypothetical protein
VLEGTGQILNGVTMNTSDRAIVKDQLLKGENGIYIVGPDDWERANDMNASEDVDNGQLVVDAATSVLYQIAVTGVWTPGNDMDFIVYQSSMPASIVLTNNNPIDLVDTDVSLNTGALDPNTEQHLEYDFDTIQSKSDATTAAPLFLNPLGSYTQALQLIAGDPGLESTGITIGGVTYQSPLKASDIGGTNVAAFIIHRHSTTLPAILVGSRTASDDETHVVVGDGDTLLAIMAVGWDGTDYEQGAQIRFQVDGVPGNDDMPGRIVFLTVPAGDTVPVERMRIRADGSIETLFGLDVTGDIVVSGDVDGVDIAAFASAFIAHEGDATIHFTEASISIPASQISDFDVEVANNAAVTANTAKVTNVPTALSIGTHTIAVLNITSDGGADDVTLPSFTDTLSGLVPGSAGGTTNFLRADGNFAAPPGAGRNFTVVVETTTARTAVAFECVLVDDDTAAGVVTITLPPSLADDMIIVKKKGTSFDVIIDGDTAELIDGLATFTLTALNSALTIIADGTGWHIV